jgi:hypothetical protein
MLRKFFIQLVKIAEFFPVVEISLVAAMAALDLAVMPRRPRRD